MKLAKGKEVKTILASELKEGMAFRLPEQRKWRIAAKVLPFPARLTADGLPGVFVCLNDCRQLIFSEGEILCRPENPQDLDRDGFVKLGRRRLAERRKARPPVAP